MLFFRRHPVLTKVVLFFVLLGILGFMILRKVIYPVFFALAEARVNRLGNRIIGEVIKQETRRLQYEQLINYEVNERGNIILMQANTQEINHLAAKITINIQEQFEPRVWIHIPLFRLFGLDMLAGIGPDIPIRIIPVGYVQTPEVIDNFESAGINQTRHKLYLRTKMKFQLVAPLVRRYIEFEAQIPLIEATILGEVPEVYIDMGNGEGGGILQ